MRSLRGPALCAALVLPMLLMSMSANAVTATTAKAFGRCTRDLAARARVDVVDSHFQAQYSDPLEIFVNPQQIELTARGLHSHHVVARAVCAYNGSGKVVRFRTSRPAQR